MAVVRSLTIDRQANHSPTHTQVSAMVSWQQRMEQAREEAAAEARQAAQAEAAVKINELKKEIQQFKQEAAAELQAQEASFTERWSQALAVLGDLAQQRQALLRSGEQQIVSLALHCAGVILHHEVRSDPTWCHDLIGELLAAAVQEDHSQLLVTPAVAEAIAAHQDLMPAGHRVDVTADASLADGELRLRNAGTEWDGGIAQAWQRVVASCEQRRQQSPPEPAVADVDAALQAELAHDSSDGLTDNPQAQSAAGEQSKPDAAHMTEQGHESNEPNATSETNASGGDDHAES